MYTLSKSDVPVIRQFLSYSFHLLQTCRSINILITTNCLLSPNRFVLLEDPLDWRFYELKTGRESLGYYLCNSRVFYSTVSVHVSTTLCVLLVHCLDLELIVRCNLQLKKTKEGPSHLAS